MPDHPLALHGLGVLAHQTGRGAEAEAWLRRAVSRAPQEAAFHNSLGNVLRERGDRAGAIAAYRAALGRAPNEPTFLHHLGLALADSGDDAEAETLFRRALRLARDRIALRLDLAHWLIRHARPHEAELVLQPALRAAPDQAAALNALGLALTAQRKGEEALAAFDRALAAAPDHATTRINRAAALEALDRLEEAAAAYEAAPKDASVWIALGKIRHRQKHGAQAEQAFREALRLAPDDAATRVALGSALAMQARLDEALVEFESVCRSAPLCAEAWHRRALTLRDLARWEESLPVFREAARLAPDDSEIRSNFAYALLAFGDFEQGWAEFEWRNGRPGNARLREPLWDGGPTDRPVLIHAEQGMGDTIQFARFVAAAAARAPVVFAGPRALKRLFAQLEGAPPMRDADPLPRCAAQLPLMSLPRALGIAPAHFADAVPYLRAETAAQRAWEQRLAHLPGPRIGLVWAGNPDYPADRKRSIPFATMATLLAFPASFVSLQCGAAPADARLFDASPHLTDFAETAAAIVSLDLIIAVDTAVAHLAGALGRPIWLLNRADTDWRWMLGRDDTPWYPTMRIFRQPRPGDWPSVITAVQRALADFA